MNSSAREGSLVLQRKNFFESEVSINSPFFLLPARASSSTSCASLRAFCICKMRLSHSFPALPLRSNHSLTLINHRAHNALDRRVVQAIFSLSLKLRVDQFHRNHHV